MTIPIALLESHLAGSQQCRFHPELHLQPMLPPLRHQLAPAVALLPKWRPMPLLLLQLHRLPVPRQPMRRLTSLLLLRSAASTRCSAIGRQLLQHQRRNRVVVGNRIEEPRQ